MTRDEFNELYWAAQPTLVRALRNMDAGGARTQSALDLAKQGYAVDVMIGVYGFEPWGTMSSRQLQGFAWAPALLQDYALVQYPIMPWEIGPNTPMPNGAIKTSLDPADYPAFDPPKPPDTPVLLKNPVGAQAFDTIYCCNFGDNWAVGQRYTDARGTFEKKGTHTPFGAKMWWEKVG